MEESSLLYWVALNMVPDISARQFHTLIAFYQKDLKKSFLAKASELSKIPRITPRTVEAIEASKLLLNRAEVELKNAAKRGIKLICFDDMDYPDSLKEIHDPPALLYVQGVRFKINVALAVVGTRLATPYGLEVTTYLVKALAHSGVTIVSGLARGIDRRAHEAALEAQGHTIAVVGNGLSVVYPREHRNLYEQIADQGALISEFPLETGPNRYHFPKRNRIISGLSRGVLVVEAPAKSGALITANFALEQGREVFAVPGKIHSRVSAGTHALIQQGAKLVVRPSDILEELKMPVLKDILTDKAAIGQSLTQDEERILQLLENRRQFGEIADASKMDVDRLSEILLSFELRGLIARKNDQYYRKTVCLSHSSL